MSVSVCLSASLSLSLSLLINHNKRGHAINCYSLNIMALAVSGTTTGPSCVRDCKGLSNGRYQSCHGCNIYVICRKGYLMDHNPCPIVNSTGELEYWDDVNRKCQPEKSKTCDLHDIPKPEPEEEHGKL